MGNNESPRHNGCRKNAEILNVKSGDKYNYHNSFKGFSYGSPTCSPPIGFVWPAATFVDHVYKKAVPLQAWSGPEGSRKLRFPDFMITAQEVR